MFGIGGSEIIFIIFIFLMLFGADKVPEIARSLGKGMAQLKNATNDIKSEIQRSAEEHGFDKKSLTAEFDEVKGSYEKLVADNSVDNPLDIQAVKNEIDAEINKAKVNLEDLTGPIKRHQ